MADSSSEGGANRPTAGTGRLGRVAWTLVAAGVVFVAALGGTYVAQTSFAPAEQPTPGARLGDGYNLVEDGEFRIEAADDETRQRMQQSLSPSSTIRAPGEPFTPSYGRHAGPFVAGSVFRENQIVLQPGPSLGANWYHNDYYVGHADASIVAQYYPSGVPGVDQPNPTPEIHDTPGARGLPIIFSLESVSYSSQFGGSVELLFLMTEDLGFEFESGEDLWDVGILEMSIYVNPVQRVFNPVTNADRSILFQEGQRPKHVEFRAAEVTSYLIVPGGTFDPDDIVRRSEADAVPVEPLLSTIASQIEDRVSITDPATRFTHAFIHIQFQDLIGPTDAVDYVELTDSFFMPYTREREPYLVASFRFSYLYSVTELTNDEYVVTWTLFHCPLSAPCEVASAGETPEFPSGESSGWFGGGGFAPDQCPPLGILQLSIFEKDPFDDDYLGTDLLDIIYPCSRYQQEAASGNYGVLDHYSVHVDQLDPWYAYRLEFMVQLTLI